MKRSKCGKLTDTKLSMELALIFISFLPKTQRRESVELGRHGKNHRNVRHWCYSNSLYDRERLLQLVCPIQRDFTMKWHDKSTHVDQTQRRLSFSCKVLALCHELRLYLPVSAKSKFLIVHCEVACDTKRRWEISLVKCMPWAQSGVYSPPLHADTHTSSQNPRVVASRQSSRAASDWPHDPRHCSCMIPKHLVEAFAGLVKRIKP